MIDSKYLHYKQPQQIIILKISQHRQLKYFNKIEIYISIYLITMNHQNNFRFVSKIMISIM